ncbi:MAG: IS21 family transposase, partial [Gemmatimonadaceae bacterium]
EAIAAQVAVGKRSVQRVVDEPMITSITEFVRDPALARRRPGRRSKVAAYRERVTAWLKEDPELLSVELLRRAKLAGYDGAKSALYALVRTVRPSTPRPMIRFEGLPGEFTQHDFGEVLVRFLNGTTERVHFFASRLKYSRWVEVSIVPNEQVETLARSLVDHFVALGGIPLLAVFDRPKTVALSWQKNGEVTEWNPIFAAVVLDLGLGIEVCWPHAPQQKGAIENLVGWVKGSFFKQRRFLDPADLEQQLREWLIEVNTMRPSRATGAIPAVRRAEELPRLRPLKVTPQALALRMPIIVGPTGYVLHDTHRYSMPPEAIGIAGTLYLYRERIRIVVSRCDVTHERLCTPNAVSTLPTHRAEMVAAISGKRGKRYLKRQHLLELGEPALAYLTELTHRRPRRWTQDVDRLHALLQTEGPTALCAAFRQGLAARVFGAEYIAHYLDAAHALGGSPRELTL